MAQKQRPKGVTIIAVLDVIAGILGIFAGLVLIALPSLLSSANLHTSQLESKLGIPIVVLPIFGAFILTIGIASFVVAVGMLKGKGWSWTTNVILSIIGIGWAIVTGAIGRAGDPTGGIGSSVISIIIDGIILYYLYRPHVKAYFGRLTSTTMT